MKKYLIQVNGFLVKDVKLVNGKFEVKLTNDFTEAKSFIDNDWLKLIAQSTSLQTYKLEVSEFKIPKTIIMAAAYDGLNIDVEANFENPKCNTPVRLLTNGMLTFYEGKISDDLNQGWWNLTEEEAVLVKKNLRELEI